MYRKSAQNDEFLKVPVHSTYTGFAHATQIKNSLQPNFLVSSSQGTTLFSKRTFINGT